MRREQQPALKLPRADEAAIDPKKLRDYALDPDHERGKDKARVFQSALGIGKGDWAYLRDQILDRLRESEVKSVEPWRRGFQYRVTVWIDGLNGATQPVATRWLVEQGEPPRLTTAWVDI